MKTRLALSIINYKKHRFEILYYFLLLLLSIFFHYGHALNADEGVVLNGAWNLLNNQRLYIDFVEIIPPGSFYLIYWGFKIFGAEYYVANIISLLLVFGSAIGIYKSLNLIKKQQFNLLLPIIFVLSLAGLPIINHNLYNSFFIIWAVYFFILGLNKEKTLPFCMSGFFGGLAIIFLQQKGLAFWAASILFLFIYWIIKKEKEYFIKIINYVIFSLIPILVVLLSWPINILYHNLITFPMFNYWDVNKTPLYVFFIVLLIFLYFLYQLKNKSQEISYLLFIQFFLLMTTLPLPDFYHVVLIVFPLLILSPTLYSVHNRWHKTTVVIILLAFTVLRFLYTLPTFEFFYNYKKDNPNWMEYIKKECPGKYIYSAPFFPNLYFETKKINATPFGLLIEGYSTKEQFGEALISFKRNNPDCAVLIYYPSIENKFKHQGKNVLETYIINNYEFISNENDISIYKNRNIYYQNE